MPVDKYRQTAVRTITRLARPQSGNPGITPGDALLHPEPRLQPRTGYAHHLPSNGMMLSGGMVFVLAMAMHASTLWNVHRNILELTGISADIRGLAAHSDELARAMDYSHRIPEPARPEYTDTPSNATPTAITTLTPTVDTEKPQTDTAGIPASSPSVSHRSIPGDRLAYGKWGPPLVSNISMASRVSATRYTLPDREQVQTDLLVLGFDVNEDHANGRTGKRTLQAIDEFRLLYLPASDREKKTGNDQIAASIRKYATLARKDAHKFNIESGILAAIRLGSQRTGVEFSFLMELAATESSFDPTSIAPITAAAGLYQFKDDTWLDAIRSYGKKYGMRIYASQVENYTDAAGNSGLRIPDPAVNTYVLALRHNPRLSALLAGEYVKLNRKQLSASLDREPGHTEMYLTHFFGATGALSFLKALYENPDRIAGEVFPRAAEHNQALFHPTAGKPRTVAEIYNMFERKFSRSRYRDANPS